MRQATKRCSTGYDEAVEAFGHALFASRREAGLCLAAELERSLEADWLEQGVVVGLARGGVVVAAAVAAELSLPLDAVVVRKIGHPESPEYALGAVAAAGAPYLRASLPPSWASALAVEVERKAREVARLDARLHADEPPFDLRGRVAVLVDDGLATGASMIAALRSVHARGAWRAVAAVPVGAFDSLEEVQGEADAVVCPYPLRLFSAVGAYYRDFGPVTSSEVSALLRVQRSRDLIGV